MSVIQGLPNPKYNPFLGEELAVAVMAEFQEKETRKLQLELDSAKDILVHKDNGGKSSVRFSSITRGLRKKISDKRSCSDHRIAPIGNRSAMGLRREEQNLLYIFRVSYKYGATEGWN